MRRSLCQAAWAASHTKATSLAARFRRLAARKGKKRAIVAVAHSILVIVYHVLKTKQPYRELGADYLDRINAAQLKRYLVKRLENLGLQVTVQSREEVVSLVLCNRNFYKSVSFLYSGGMTRNPNPLQLSREDRRSLTPLLRSGTGKNRQHTRARILDLLDRQVPPAEIAPMLSCALGTGYNVKGRYENEGLEAALTEKPRSGRPIEIDGAQRAKLTALACSTAPAGHARWTLRLLADKAIELGFVDHLSHNAVTEILKKTASNPT